MPEFGQAEREAEKLIGDLIIGTEFDGITFVVGGFVRDEVMGRASDDIDITVEMDGGAERLANFIYDRLGGSVVSRPRKLGESYPIWNIVFKENVAGIWHGMHCKGAELDIADTQAENAGDYADPNSRQRTARFGTIEEDIKRRDFTINMLAKDIVSRKLVDLTGTSFIDIDNIILRAHPEVDPLVTFETDPLRLVRLARFKAVLCGIVDEELMAAAIAKADRIKIVAQERILKELTKACLAGRLGQMVEAMSEQKLLQHIMPEIEAMNGCSQEDVRNIHQEGDVFVHTMLVCKNAKPTVRDQFAALYHDAGKVVERKELENGKVMFAGHPASSAVIADKALTRMKFDTATKRDICKLVGMHMRPCELKYAKDNKVRKLIREVGDLLDPLLDLTEADYVSTLPVGDEKTDFRTRVASLEKERPTAPTAILDGHEIMRVLELQRGGPIIGEAVAFLLELQDEGQITREEAVVAIKQKFPGQQREEQ